MDDYGARWLLGLMHFYGLYPENVDKAVEHWKISAQNDNTMAKRYFVPILSTQLNQPFKPFRDLLITKFGKHNVDWC